MPSKLPQPILKGACAAVGGKRPPAQARNAAFHAVDYGGRDSSCRYPPLRILLADDNWLNRDLAAAVLELDGFRADVARDGRQAVEAAARAEYDLILMDVEMPELDGIRASMRIRELPRPHCKVWIVAVSGSNALETYQQRSAAGIDDFIAKPYHPDILREKLSWIDAFRPQHR